MEGLINVTLDAETYKKYVLLYEQIKANKHCICFDNEDFIKYSWVFYTKDRALLKMAEKYEFMIMKFCEQKRDEINALKDRIKELESTNK